MSYEATYDPINVTLSLGGRIITGYDASSKITVARNSDSVLPKVDVEGGVIYDENADKTGTLTLSLMSTSSSLAYIRDLEMKRKRFSVLISDVNDDDPVKVSADDCRVTKLPDIARNKESGTVSVTIYIPEFIPR